MFQQSLQMFLLHLPLHSVLPEGCHWYSAGSHVIEARAIVWNLMLLSNHVSRGK